MTTKENEKPCMICGETRDAQLLTIDTDAIENPALCFECAKYLPQLLAEFWSLFWTKERITFHRFYTQWDEAALIYWKWAAVCLDSALDEARDNSNRTRKAD
jgi:hypothetical protein